MIPIRTDRRNLRPPLVNYVIIAANVAVFILIQRAGAEPGWTRQYYLDPTEPRLFQFIACTFMHASWWHLIGNMIFLWVFGNAVNDSFGHVGYLAFYLAGGIFAGIGYVTLGGDAPVLGASGAISAVTGAFLVLFPRVRVTVLAFLLYMLVPFEISSLFFIALQVAFNMYATVQGSGGGVAYAAHSSGYAFGIAVAATLLLVKMLPRDVYDLPSLIRNWRRRWTYRRMVAGGYNPYSYGGSAPAGPAQAPTAGQWTVTPAAPQAPPRVLDEREVALRQQIADAHARGDFPAAADAYLKLVQTVEDPLLPMHQQLDVANYLMSAEQYPAAADAYERFLRQYGNYPHLADIWLMLGLIYSRYLHQYDQAEQYLAKAVAGLTDARKNELGQTELALVRRRLGR
jgi:membrane associated rhomboid family serine protease